ncbi:Retinol dehydrogenase 14 [Tyrophagus putrescentiae]|nr:Retinol dehydrogenase 14 [Tyrophagus putrescentiae]
MSLLLLLLLLLCLLFTALLAAVKLYFSLTKGVFRSSDYDLTGKVILLTGGNTGIGEAYVREVARRGATVIMAVRNVARGEAVAAKVRAETGNGNGDRLHVLHCDLGELASVRRCAERIRNPKKSEDNFSAPPQIDVFAVFAAAVGENSAEGAKARLTPAPDRLEVQFQVNYLGHFLLLTLLFDLLQRSPHCRVVVTSSAAHLLGKLDLERMATEKSRHVYFTYADSKLALVAWARELAERLENSSSSKNSHRITVNCFSPGTVLTNGITHNYFWWIRLLLRALAFLYGSRTAEDGAQTMLYLSMAEEKDLVAGSSGGGYFADCRPAAYNRLADDRKLRAGLWELSLSLLTEKERGLLSIDEVDPLLRGRF